MQSQLYCFHIQLMCVYTYAESIILFLFHTHTYMVDHSTIWRTCLVSRPSTREGLSTFTRSLGSITLTGMAMKRHLNAVLNLTWTRQNNDHMLQTIYNYYNNLYIATGYTLKIVCACVCFYTISKKLYSQLS